MDSFLTVRPGDAPKYLQLAHAPFSPASAPSAPFRFRAVTPILVWLLPTPPVAGFAVVNLSALVATGIVLYYYLRDLGFDAQRSIFGTALFVISPAVAYLVTNLVLVDGVALFVSVCAFWAAFRDRPLVFAALLAVGVATKESVLFALPVYALYGLRMAGFRGVSRAAATAVPAGIVYLGIRAFYGFSNDTLGAIIARGVAAQLHKLALSVFYIPYEVYSAFGTLWLLAALFGILVLPGVARSCPSKRRTAFLAAGMAITPFAFLQPLIARNITRVLFIVFPVVIPAGLLVIDHLSWRVRFGSSAFAATAGVVGVGGALFVLPALAGSVASVSLPALQYLALVGAANELVVIAAILTQPAETPLTSLFRS